MTLTRVDIEGHVATLSLNRPDARNALSIQMCEDIVVALHGLETEMDARVAVIRGEGPTFCAGADFAAVSGPDGIGFLPAFERMLEAVARCRLPTVASIHGAALGGGLQLATACDFRLASDDARLGIPSGRLGILVNFDNIQRLVFLVGPAVAKEILLTARTYTGSEAVAAGLLNRSVPPGDLTAETAAFADRIAGLAPLSVQGSKRAIQVVIDHLGDARTTRAEETLEIDRLVAEAYNSADLQEGINAMSEKRAPNFEGR